MTAPSFESFDEFWPYYVLEHSKKATRNLHFLGTAGALSAAIVGLATRKTRWLALAPLLGYGPAWVSHFFIEKNRPATFDYPLWSLRADIKMFGFMLAGEMDAVVAACERGGTAASTDEDLPHIRVEIHTTTEPAPDPRTLN